MSKYRFTANQRYAVYKAFDGHCEWCHQPVPFSEFHVDHVLPEILLKEPDRLKAVLQTFGLDESFNLNDYENWIPTHASCNQGKGKMVYEGVPIIRTVLDACAKNKQKAHRIELMFNREPQKVELITRVQDAIEKNQLEIKELQDFILKTNLMEEDDDAFRALKEELEGLAAYRAEKVIRGLMDLVQSNTLEILKSMRQSLGINDWEVGFTPEPKRQHPNALGHFMRNRVNENLTIRIFVEPEVVDKQLIIRFRNDHHILETMVYDIEKGIDWDSFRATLKRLYMQAISEKIRNQS